jgi:hypothetical protein
MLAEDYRVTSTPSKLTLSPMSWEQYLRESAVPRATIDNFLHLPEWAKFDPELGYVLHNSLIKWGIDGSRAIATFQSTGARSRFLYASRTPRINSYGNSFTECNQVSDGETWQEYLGAHFGEPIGNYGVGGHGVYQAYRRMLREEKTHNGAEYVILYVWGDDPTRSLMRARWGAIYHWFKDAAFRQRVLFHGNPWAHIEMDLTSGCFIEKENPLSTPELVYKMCDPEWMLDYLYDDLAVQLTAYIGMPNDGRPGSIIDLDRKRIDRLADALDVRFDWSSGADVIGQSVTLLNVYGQRATNHILDRARVFAQSTKKKLLVVLNYTARPDAFKDPIVAYDGARADQKIVEHLVNKDFYFFDMNAVHQREYEEMKGSYREYMSRYHVQGASHYNPRGNHLFAYSIKSKLLEVLDPKPLPYRDLDTTTIDFSGYLPGA